MSLNVNVTTRRKQLAILLSVLAGAAAATTGIMLYGGEGNAPQNAETTPVPNMTGVVTATFDEEVNASALQQQQAKTSALESQMALLNGKFDQQTQSFEQKLSQKDAEIQKLNDQLQQRPPTSSSTTSQQTPPAGMEGTPLPGPVAAGQIRPPEYSVTPAASGAVNGSQGVGFYPGGSGQRPTGGLTTTTFSYDSLKKKPPKLPWIPSGSFSEAILIEGADANASVTGQQNSRPVTIRLKGKVQMPNNHEYDMSGCFVVGEIWGDISSERGEVRTKSISCMPKHGAPIDMAFEGHVSYQGKGGIKGTPVMRNGKIVGYAAGAGFLSGIGEGVKSAATPSVGLGATADVSAGDVFKQGMGGGASKAADNLSQYWIKRAEQYHPVIDIGAGNEVTVVFQEGFQLKTIEETDEEKVKAAAEKAGETAKNAATPTPTAASSGTTTTTATAAGNINPDEILRQARELRLGDTIN
ncbi:MULTISPECIES: F-type conjugal transfer pilus assembly protein TraB [Pseudescherichia]|uniref:F-type conjugal transfer pilus assembly protein TraB n=1 Tax=Pseudescherichia TaxID=2055880 RepID=UPI0028A8F4C3|nr:MULTISPECIES: F-type conjugal transfer pilus assembly protein TraB [Pseudescherichia]